MKQIQIATYFLMFIHFLRMIFRRVHSKKQCKNNCPSDSSCPLALYYQMMENGKLNLHALVFYLDDEGIRTELLRFLMRDFDGDAIHYLDARRNPIDLRAPFPLTLNRCIAHAPVLDMTKWVGLVRYKVEDNFFNDPKHGKFRFEDFFIERIEK